MLLPLKAPPHDGHGGHDGSDGFEPGQMDVSQVYARLLGQFLGLEARAARLLLVEAMQRQQEMGKAFGILARPFFIYPHNTLEMQEISRHWFELIGLTQSAFVRAFFSFPAVGLMYPIPGQNSWFKPERRLNAKIIPFPDRRAAKQ